MDIFESINHYWGIVIFLAGLIFHALWTYFKVGEHSTKIKTLEDGSGITNNAVADIKNQISNIDAKLDVLLTGYHKNK